MAATDNYYRTEVLTTESVADPLVMITNRLAIPFMTKALLLAAFYLDDLLMLETEGGTEGFTGLVNITGPNYLMHNIARVGSVKSEDPSANAQTCYLDGALNTLGWADIPVSISVMNGALEVRVPLLKSAYFVDSTLAGIELATDNTFVANRDWVDEFLSQNTTDANFSLITGYDFGVGTTVYYRAYVKNVEGDYYSPIRTLVVKPLIVSLRFGTTITNAVTGSLGDYLIDINRMTMGAHLYNDNVNHTLITNANPGYYDDGTRVYKIEAVGGFSEVTAIGTSGVEGSTGGGGSAPAYVTWTTWSGPTALKAYQGYQQSKPSVDYLIYDATTTANKNIPSAVDGFYAHVVDSNVYVHQVINEEVIEPATIYTA